MDELQQRRMARTEATFREANASISTKVDGFRSDDASGTDQYHLMCECALESCEQMIDVDGDTYRQTRAHDAWFLVVPDHAIGEIERPVQEHDGLWVIEKVGPGRKVAEERDVDVE